MVVSSDIKSLPRLVSVEKKKRDDAGPKPVNILSYLLDGFEELVG